MNKMIVWTVFFATASLLAEPLPVKEEVAVAEVSATQEQSEKEALVVQALQEPTAEIADAAPVLKIEATEPATMESAPTQMEEPKSQSTSMNTKKEEKTGSSRFANIAIGTASAAVVIVAAILGSN